jgi:hypothetical protein
LPLVNEVTQLGMTAGIFRCYLTPGTRKLFATQQVALGKSLYL